MTEIKNIALKDLHNNTGFEIESGRVNANPRVIRDVQYKNLLQSLRESNLTDIMPLKVFEHNGKYIVIGGNMRLRALKELKAESVDCILIPQTYTADMLNKAIIIDNSTHGDWDMDMLANEWNADLLSVWGIDLPEYKEEAVEEVEVQEDDFDEEKDKVETVCKKGDIWLLGQHRLMCGDSTKPEDFAKLMQGQKADLTFTSPPYNGDNSCGDGDIFQSKRNQRLYADGYSDDLPSSEYVKFASSVLGICFENTEGFIFWNVNYNSNSKFEYIQQIIPFLPYLIEQVVWKKSSAIPLKGCMRRAWEPVYIFSNTRKNLGTEVVETNIWEISNTHSQGEDHKACFPVGLPAKGISLVKPKTGIVLEPFGGTGTTIIAAEQLGRKCYTMEIDPHYCDVIIARWEKLTGQKATLIK